MTSAEGAEEAEDARYAPEEIRAAVAAMPPDEMRRVELIVRYFAHRSGLNADDLRQEAFLRVLGSRSCRVGTTMVEFLAGTIQSIASEPLRSRREAKKAGKSPVTLLGDGDPAGLSVLPADGPSPEEAALAAVFHARQLERALAAVGDDYELQLLVEGLFDGKRGSELEELLETDTKGLAAVKKKLSRRLQARFPQGAPL